MLKEFLQRSTWFFITSKLKTTLRQDDNLTIVYTLIYLQLDTSYTPTYNIRGI